MSCAPTGGCVGGGNYHETGRCAFQGFVGLRRQSTHRHRLISPLRAYSAQTVETMHNSRAGWQESTAGKAAVGPGGRLNLRPE
jgi:hypothetical protein